MKITLTKVSYCAALSQETNAFSATVCIDGVPAFIAENQGHGGCDNQHPLKGQTYEQMRAAVARIEEFAKTLPPHEAYGMKLDESMEGLVGKALDAYLGERELKRKLKSSLLFTRADGKLYGVSLKGRPAAMVVIMKQQYRSQGAVDFLDEVPFERAMEIYRKTAA